MARGGFRRIGGTSAGAPSAAAAAVERARDACANRDWATAFELLIEAERDGQVGPADLETMAECARRLGHNERIVEPYERAHRAYTEAGDQRGAARTALALCQVNGDMRNDALASSWWKRADELITGLPEGPEHAWHAWFRAKAISAGGDLAEHERAASTALDIARRVGDRNVQALAMVELGDVAAARGRSADAHAAIEWATSLAIGGELGVLEAGMVFCSAIWTYRCCGEWGRALEWTELATRWADDKCVGYFPGLCRIHRSEVLRIRGELAAAEHESREAARYIEKVVPRFAMIAHAELGEVRRRRGDHAGAMASFRRALELGWDPQPGLALLILAQGDPPAAFRALERVFVQPVCTMLCMDRTNLLLARALVAAAAGELSTAEEATRELEEFADRNQTVLAGIASAAQARGEIERVQGRPASAAMHFARAAAAWAELQAPYEFGLARKALGAALLAEGDIGGAQLELGAAERIFARIGADFERERVGAMLAAEPRRADEGGCTALLHREGDYWSLGFDGRTFRLKDGRGLRYLAALLARPNESHWSIDLAGGGAARGARAFGTAAGDAGELLDVEARAAYRRRLEELQEELDDARERHDEAATETILREMDDLGRVLAAAIGLGGRARRVGGAIERARQSVTKALHRTIRKIAGEDPSLGRYLEATVSTGTACRFEPDPRFPIDWQVEVDGV
jgi:tetratricopeptide (TPR) repeat protein